MKAKPTKGQKILVHYGYDDKTWYHAEVRSLLSIQFTAELDYKDGKRYNFYMYNDNNITWKEIEDVKNKSRTRSRRKNN